MKALTMITRHGMSKDEITGYTLITNDYQTVKMSTNEVVNAIKSKKVAITNLTVGPKGIESTNGALDKYTFINEATNQVEGAAKAVILDRVEVNGRLAGYTVFMQNGTLAELNVADAVALVEKKLVSNGKIRHTDERDIVSAIGGNYPLREIKIADAPKGEITTELIYFGTAVGSDADYFGAIVSCTSATEMSRIIDVLSKSNAKIVGQVVKVAGQSARESLAIKRMGTNSLYGVFDISILEKLAKNGAKIQNKVGNITVSAVKYSGEDVEEATAKLSKDWKASEPKADSTVVANRLKEYTKTIIGKFSSVKIQ